MTYGISLAKARFLMYVVKNSNYCMLTLMFSIYRQSKMYNRAKYHYSLFHPEEILDVFEVFCIIVYSSLPINA